VGLGGVDSAARIDWISTRLTFNVEQTSLHRGQPVSCTRIAAGGFSVHLQSRIAWPSAAVTAEKVLRSIRHQAYHRTVVAVAG